MTVMKESVKEGSSLELAEDAERRKGASPEVSVATFFVRTFDESPVMMNASVDGMSVCVVSAVRCMPL